MADGSSLPSPPASPLRGDGRDVRANIEDLLSGSGELYSFVVTGGPCAGKTTGMERLAVFLRERGFRVFMVPEAATIAFLNGAFPDDLASLACQYAFQQFVINTQMSLEDSFKRYARSLGPDCKSVILCDRGIMDGAAYVDEDTWAKVLAVNRLDTISAREGRYNAVFHLVTAADGAESFYSLSNNLARHESCEQACILDRKTQRAWSGHPHHILIDNRNGRSFERKMEQFVSMVAEAVGLPSLTRRRHKFVLRSPPDVAVMMASVPNVQVFEVEKILLADEVGAFSPAEAGSAVSTIGSSSGSRNGSSSGGGADAAGDVAGGEGAPSTSSTSTSTSTSSNGNGSSGKEKVLYSFVRRRSQGGFHAYGLTTVKELSTGEHVELKQVISRQMYSVLQRSADKSRRIVRQRRYCFLYQTQSLHVYQYLEPHEGIWTLHVHSEGEPVIPAFLDVAPVGGDIDPDAYSTREISRIDRPESPKNWPRSGSGSSQR